MSEPITATESDLPDLPHHVAIIMDGNGRWAQQRGKLRVLGHKAGVKTVRNTVSSAVKLNIKALTLFAFSSENWRRPEGEVNALMELFFAVLDSEIKRLHKKGARLRIIGDLTRFSERLQRKIAQAEQLTAQNKGLQLNIAANYGGQWDIVQAAKAVAVAVENGEQRADEIDEGLFAQKLCLHELPPVDLLIRTGGDYRISNFLLWQIAYAELYFTPTLWPDFDESALCEAIASFSCRERRFGCTSEQIRSLLNDRDSPVV